VFEPFRDIAPPRSEPLTFTSEALIVRSPRAAYDGETGPAARTLGRHPEGRQRAQARETMEPRRTEFKGRASTLSPATERRRPPLEPLADTLVERVDKLVLAGKEPLLSTTSTSLAIRELIYRTEALENALREIALEVQTAHHEPPE
jgi:hypothetical protein